MNKPLSQLAAKYDINLVRPWHKKLAPLGVKIHEHCLDYGISQQGFADKAGITRITLRAVMFGETKTTKVRVFEAIMKALGEMR